MADAAHAWLDSLNTEQRSVAAGATPGPDASDAERRRWFYTPTDHGGLTVHAQRPAQQRLGMALVATGLSTAGYVTVATVMGLENVLDHTEGFRTIFDRERGRDPGLYYLRVFGEPGGATPWGWRFGGHHVSLNNLVVDGELVATTPCFLGADPASSPLLGGAVNRPLGRVEDLARELVQSLPPDLATRAVLLDKAPSDFVTANRTVLSEDDRVIPLTGIFRRRFPDPAEQAKLQALSDTIDEVAASTTQTTWRSPTRPRRRGSRRPTWTRASARCCARFWRPTSTACRPRSRRSLATTTTRRWTPSMSPGRARPRPARRLYRLQGPRLLVEWDNTQRGANHAHSVWRDPAADFGLDVLTAHRAAHH